MSDTAADGSRLLELVELIAGRTDVSEATVLEALERLATLAIAQAEGQRPARQALEQALQADLDLLDPLPRASVSQARRVTATRNRLVSSGAWTVAALADVHGFSPSSARGWIKRHRDAHRLVTVSLRGETFVPALLLDEAAEPVAGIDRVVGPLVSSGMDGWAVWRWLDTPSGWLDGSRPADLLNPAGIDTAARAARSQAAGAAGMVGGTAAA